MLSLMAHVNRRKVTSLEQSNAIPSGLCGAAPLLNKPSRRTMAVWSWYNDLDKEKSRRLDFNKIAQLKLYLPFALLPHH